ncbi:ROK family protein [Microbacterium sp. K24]|uniref:ROK family protein n=1 Tax=Microbacterium sp. K24 TaxID=2305446 RepID=UPI0014446F7F|nr:ROK family protein [Microbacterium sp. K24]
MKVIGVDIGGTNIRAALFDDGAEIRTVVRAATLGADERPAGTMLTLIREVGGEDPVAAVGMAITGPVDVRTRIVHNPHTLPDWSGSAWVDEVEAALGVPIVVENDAMGAAFGEFARGAGREAEVMAMVTLGTGIGVAVVSRATGALRGAAAFHPEAGHLLIGSGALDRVDRCYCGQVGCWEELCSGSSIPKYWTTGGRIRWDDYGQMLARGIRNVTRAYAPDTVVFGGGVSANFDDFAPALREASAEPDPMGAPVVFVRAELDEPGCVGAAHLAAALAG